MLRSTVRAKSRRPAHGRKPSRGGFTLIELLLVLAILGILATLVVVNVAPTSQQSRITKAKNDISTLKMSVDSYFLNLDRYPTQEDGLRLLLDPPADDAAGDWKGPYVKDRVIPNDPWGRPYIYRWPGTVNTDSYDLFSAGRDGVEGNADDVW